jgi:hypothetical protein
MSCKEEDKRNQALEHLKSHIVKPCPKCNKPMQPNEGTLPFGNAMMVIFNCADCAEESVSVLQEDGTLLSPES